MESYTIDELLHFIQYWINHYNQMKLFLEYTFIAVEDKPELIKSLQVSRYMIFKYIGLLMQEIG